MRKRSSLVTENVHFFPEEILFEILSWLEVKSLLRFKSVCKVWYAVIRNKQFVEVHAIRNRHSFYNIGQTRVRLQGTKKIRYRCISCGGLLLVQISSLVSATSSAIYRIVNPTTKRILDLPHPHKRVISIQIFLNSNTSSYNVVSVYFGKENREVKLELIDLGGQSNDPCPNENLSWRTLKIIEFDNISKQQRYHFLYRMSSSEGVLYILALHAAESSNPMIIRVDLVNEACTTHYAPQSLLFKWFEVNFQLWKGKPSIIFVVEEKLNIWILEDYKTRKWANPIVILLPFLEQNPFLKTVVPYIYEDDKEDALVYRKDSLCYRVYKLNSKELCTIPCPPLRAPATLVSVKGMQPEKKER